MNQYQRMVSYLYEYRQGVKGVNVGFVRIEQRGEICRIQIQMRGRNLENVPAAACFKQDEEGIRCLEVGQMTERNGGYYCRIDTNTEDILGQGISFSEIDGLILYQNESYYIATSWKNAEILPGKIRTWGEEKPIRELETDEDAACEEREAEIEQETEVEIAEEKEIEEQTDIELEEKNPESAASSLETQAVCGNCPFRRKDLDYGKKILMTFPSMRPFPKDENPCVRIEPQDIGCLPMQMWSLANNHFLLHGYYSYRHLVFLETGQKRYAIGVPGIFNERDRQQARQYGFSDFRSICTKEQCRGAFGYWLMPLSD